MRKWDNLYEAIKIGESTRNDIHRLFGEGDSFVVNSKNVDWMVDLEKGGLRQQAIEESIGKYPFKNLALLFYRHRFDEGGYTYFFVFVYNATNNLVIKKFKALNKQKAVYDLSEGFIVEGEQAENFLRETLSQMGLTPREYNEFIVYWYPKLKNNKYNLVHFAHEEYEEIAKLEISPKPDSMLRVFMVYKPLAKRIEIKPQEIKPFTRHGFPVIEWGGTELDD